MNEFCPQAKCHFSDSRIPDLLVPLRNCTWPDDSSQHASQCCSDDLDLDREDPAVQTPAGGGSEPGAESTSPNPRAAPQPEVFPCGRGAGAALCPLCRVPRCWQGTTFALHSRARDTHATLRGWKLSVSLSRQTGLHLPARVMCPRYHFINKEWTGFHSKAAYGISGLGQSPDCDGCSQHQSPYTFCALNSGTCATKHRCSFHTKPSVL